MSLGLHSLNPGPTVAPSEAERYTRALAKAHYENFLVVSWLLPRHLHQPMFNLYAYCRTVDDLGDEAPGDRLVLLDNWQRQLEACYAGQPQHPVYVALAPTIREFDLPMEPFQRLIEANRRDQSVGRYQTYQDVLDYCQYSANPVGRLVLMLFGYRDEQRFGLSDATCTALQLANFWQDVARDFRLGRVYIPLEDMRRFGCTESELEKATFDAHWRALIELEVQRARDLFHVGEALIPLVERQLQVDLRLFTLGGLEVLNRIEAQGYDVLGRRPTVPAWRQFVLLATALASLLRPASRARHGHA